MTDEHYMSLALRLARKGKTSPNPMVGCVIVKDGNIIGCGYHKQAGMPHAEIEALNSCKISPKGAAMYVTLEPCIHYGKTPPCVDRIISAEISAVYIAMEDPDKKVCGQGIKALQAAGIKTRCGILEEEAKELNCAYIKHRQTGLPFTTLKSAMSLDGKIACASGESKWITSEESRIYAHKIRSSMDAIIIGANTARIDNPSLTARTKNKEHYPKRVIVTRSGDIPDNLKMFELPGETLIAAPSDIAHRLGKKLANLNARIIKVETAEQGIDIRNLWKKLGDEGCLNVLIEGGAELSASALEAGVVDRILFFYAPKIIGGKSAPSAIGGKGVAKVVDSWNIEIRKIKRLGQDMCIEGLVITKQCLRV